jgi:hypothetical protein
MNTTMGFFVLKDQTTQAYFAHQYVFDEGLGKRYFVMKALPKDTTIVKRRSSEGPPGRIFYAAKGTDCPNGDDCNLKAKNLLTPGNLAKIIAFETKVWGDTEYQQKFCHVVGYDKQNKTLPCSPPRSILQLMMFGDAAAKAAWDNVDADMGTTVQKAATNGLDASVGGCICKGKPALGGT